MILAHRLDGPAGAPVLVLSNSLGTTVGLWEAQLPELLPRFRVLRYDHPGHGDSPVAPDLTVEDLAERVLELLDSLELERVSFCGLSLGGMVGMALALRSPERLDRLALCSTAAYLGPPEGWYERARIVRARGLEPIADSVLSRWFTERFRADHPDVTGRFREMLTATPPHGYASCCEAIASWDARQRIREIALPTLVLVGAEDPATTLDHAAVIAGEIADARIVDIPAAAHLTNVEQPEVFTRVLLDQLTAEHGTEEAA
jgi:3-oxoadipate enol-lactonase